MLGELLSKFAHELLKALSREVTTRKHVVAAGIAKVVFLEPYPKSLTANFHGGSVRIEGADRGPSPILSSG